MSLKLAMEFFSWGNRRFKHPKKSGLQLGFGRPVGIVAFIGTNVETTADGGVPQRHRVFALPQQRWLALAFPY